MILCLCRGVSDRTVEAVIAGGARTVAQIERACGAGGDCGACRDLLDALVERARDGHHGGAAPSTTVVAGGIYEGARSGGDAAQRHPHRGADRHQ
ncbi:MAG TPA: (2Fe-2S)-binding protein, partial [Methylomirabilota bacterium]